MIENINKRRNFRDVNFTQKTSQLCNFSVKNFTFVKNFCEKFHICEKFHNCENALIFETAEN